MTRIKTAAGAALAALVLIAALEASAAEKPAPPRAIDNFRWYCVQCHGPRGDGKGVNSSPAAKLPVNPRNLTDGKDMALVSNEDMGRTITHGGGVNDLSAIMPPWGNVFTQAEIRALVAHVRKLCKCRFDLMAKERAMREAGKLLPEDPKPAGPAKKTPIQKKAPSRLGRRSLPPGLPVRSSRRPSPSRPRPTGPPGSGYS